MLAHRRRERRALARRRRARRGAGGGSGARRRGRRRPVAARRRRRGSTSPPSRWPSSCAGPGQTAGSVFAFLMKHLLAGRDRRLGRRRGRTGPLRAASSPRPPSATASSSSSRRRTPAASSRRAGRCSLPAGATILADAAEDLALREVEVAHFERDDILPPGQRLLLLRQGLARGQPRGGRRGLLRGAAAGCCGSTWSASSPLLAGERATAHVAQMLPRLARAARHARRLQARLPAALRRGRHAFATPRCRSPPPSTRCCRRPTATLLAIGWLLDPAAPGRAGADQEHGQPLRAARRRAGARCRGPISSRGFAQDPRFANLLDERDEMHGFVVHAPAAREQVEGAEVYLELVLEDGELPVPARSRSRHSRAPSCCRSSCSASRRTSRSSPRIVERPSRAVPGERPAGPARRARTAGRADRPRRRLRPARRPRRSCPSATSAQLQPILALLAGTPEAEALDLALVASRGVGVRGARAGFRTPSASIGLRGQPDVAPERDGLAAQLDLGVGGDRRPTVCSSGCRRRCRRRPGLARAACSPRPRRCRRRGLLSPALTYEDGSIYFGGAGTGGIGGLRALGLRRALAAPRRPRPAPTGARGDRADRPRGARARPAASPGTLFGDAFAHVDLAERLRRQGIGDLVLGGGGVLDASTTRPTEPVAPIAGSCARSTQRCSTAAPRPAGGSARHEGARSQPRASDLLDRRRPGRVLQPLPGPEGAGGLGRPLPRRGRAARRPAPARRR